MSRSQGGGNGQGAVRPPVLPVTIESARDLSDAYMPFLKSGGLFIPTEEQYDLGDEVFVLLDIRYDSERIPIAGTVAWITPDGGQGNRVCGIGIQFTGKDAPTVRGRIENLLGRLAQSPRATFTM